MKSHILNLLLCLLFIIGNVNAYAQEGVSDLEKRVKVLEEKLNQNKNFQVYWKNGPRMETSDKAFRVKIIGRMQIDWASFSEDEALKTEVGEFEDGIEIRRARFGISGNIYEITEFKIEYDFSGGEPEPKDVYIGLRDIPVVGTVRIGHQREPFSRIQGSTKYNIFLEKGLQNAFSPGRNTGIRVLNASLQERLAWSAGVYRESDSFGNSISEDAYNLTARLSGLPWYEEKEQRLAHLGLAVSYKHFGEDGIRFRQRPESHLAPYLVDTDDIVADSANLIGTEAAIVLGPLSFVSEYIYASVDAEKGSDPNFDGYYILASYFFTGETRPYDTSEGKFSRLKPKNNFQAAPGSTGAWEVAARYSGIDLNDEDVSGGKLNCITVALNWYLNPNTRVMSNYIFSDLDNIGDAHIFQMRFQVDF
jgi:phosphate-selective porin OprO/OprP